MVATLNVATNIFMPVILYCCNSSFRVNRSFYPTSVPPILPDSSSESIFRHPFVF